MAKTRRLSRYVIPFIFLGSIAFSTAVCAQNAGDVLQGIFDIVKQAKKLKHKHPADEATATTPSDSATYSVGGMRLGEQINLNASYDCKPSEQFTGFDWCSTASREHEARGSFEQKTSILRSAEGRAEYLNRFLSPAFFDRDEINNDIQALTRKFGMRPKISTMPSRSNLPRGIIATWGDVTLEEIDKPALAALAKGESPQQGLFVDFLNDFTTSAREKLPIYKLGGGAGYIWIATAGSVDRSRLRFLAVDVPALQVRDPSTERNNPRTDVASRSGSALESTEPPYAHDNTGITKPSVFAQQNLTPGDRNSPAAHSSSAELAQSAAASMDPGSFSSKPASENAAAPESYSPEEAIAKYLEDVERTYGNGQNYPGSGSEGHWRPGFSYDINADSCQIRIIQRNPPCFPDNKTCSVKKNWADEVEGSYIVGIDMVIPLSALSTKNFKREANVLDLAFEYDLRSFPIRILTSSDESKWIEVPPRPRTSEFRGENKFQDYVNALGQWKRSIPAMGSILPDRIDFWDLDENNLDGIRHIGGAIPNIDQLILNLKQLLQKCSVHENAKTEQKDNYISAPMPRDPGNFQKQYTHPPVSGSDRTSTSSANDADDIARGRNWSMIGVWVGPIILLLLVAYILASIVLGKKNAMPQTDKSTSLFPHLSKKGGEIQGAAAAIGIGALVGSYFLTGAPGGATEACLTRLNFLDQDAYCKLALNMDLENKREPFLRVRAAYLEQHTSRGQELQQLKFEIEDRARQEDGRYWQERTEQQQKDAQEAAERSVAKQQEFYDRLNQQRDETQRRIDDFMKR